MQQPRRGGRRAQQRRVVGQPARRAQARRLGRELARCDVPREPDRRGWRRDPVLVLLGVIRIDEAGIAAVVVAVNTVVGLGVRVLVSPVEQSAPERVTA